MAYTSEELNDGYYQDNNTYTEIGELHSNSKNAVIGRIDSRYQNTKKTSLLSPDSDRIIYNFSSDSRVADMAIREAHESITEKMIFVGKDFLSLYDSESGNFVLKEPHDFLKTLRNPYANLIDPGLGSLDISNKDNATEKLSYDSFNYVCKNLKYVISVDTYFLIISKLDNGKYVIFRFNPDTLTISKFKPRAFYTGPGSEEILDKPFVKDNVLYVLTVDSNKAIHFWSTSINDESADFVSDTTSLSGLGTGEQNRTKYTKVDDIVKIFNVTDTGIKAYAFDLSTGISSGFNYTIAGEDTANSYNGVSITELKTVNVSSTINIILLLSNGSLKIIDNGYSNKTITINTKTPVNPIQYFIENINTNFTNLNKVLRFYDSKSHCKILYNDGTNSSADSAISLLNGNSANSFVNNSFTRADEVVSNYDGKATMVDYLVRNNHTIIIGYYSENGVIKPLIKEFYDKHCTKNYNGLTNEDKEYYRPFNNGLEPDSGISVVKNIPFGTSKLVQVKLDPTISSEATDDEKLYLREDSTETLYTKGSDLWNALKESGIPFNTQISTIGRIILDGYDIPIESVLITPPDTEDENDFGSTLLSFDKNFDITSIDKKYLKFGDIVYPGILFKNNKGFLNDAMISNVYNAEGAISYYDANNGNVFENSLALCVLASVHLNIKGNDILVIGSNNGKIASINISDGSYITSEGNTFGKNPPSISSSKIADYNFAKDGEILTIVNNQNNLIILYTSGKIIEYNVISNSVTNIDFPYVSEKNCGTDRIPATFTIFNNTLVYVVNDDNKKICLFNCENMIAPTDNVCSFDNSNILSNTISIGNNIYFADSTSLHKFNTISQSKYDLISHILTTAVSGSNQIMLAYDYNDRIYIGNGSIIKYYSLSENKIYNFITNKITIGGFLTYIGDNLITVNKESNKISIIDSEGNITESSTNNSLDISNSKNKFIVSEPFKSNNTIARNIIIFNGTSSKCVTISAEGKLISTVKEFELSDNVSLAFYGKDYILKAIGTDASDDNISSNISKLKISDITSIDDVSSNVKILGFANNILYSLKDTTVKTKDFRKIHDNNFYTLQANLINLSEISELTENVTSLGFVDNGNVLAIGYSNGAIESIFIPEFNSGNGFFKHNYGDVLESYTRTTYIDCTPTADTNLSSLTVPVENGRSFIGWSYSESEDDMISVESSAAISSIIISANQKIYAVMKDNSEEYVDRSPERLYAKAGEFFNESILSIETVGDDTYFKTSTKSIRWANDIGVFFEGHDEYFTGKISSNEFKYNHEVLQSKLYINGAGKINIGKYIFYINGYNPLDIEPQTSVHNGIVVYDSQFDEYAVLSSGKDKLHGTILSRINSYCYYNNGYIYIFGGLERRDIHTSNGNNYSKLNRTNKIERYDIRSGEFCILDALYGPEDSYSDADNTDLKYCGEKEIRQLSRVNDVLKGTIRISELSKQYDFSFDLTTEESTNTDKTYETTKAVTYYLSDDTKIELVKTGSNYKLGSVTVVSSPDYIKSFEPKDIGNNEYLFFIAYTKDSKTVLNKYLYNSDKSIILLDSISSKTDKLGNVYLKESNEVTSDKTFNIGNNEYLIDNSPIAIESRTKISFKIGKLILKDIEKTRYESDTVHAAVSEINETNDVFFYNDIEYIVSLSSGKLTVTKYIKSEDHNSTEIKVTGTKFKATLQKDEDMLTIVAYTDSGNISEVFNYRLDNNNFTKRPFTTDCVLSSDSNLLYSSYYKAIFVSANTLNNGSFIIQGLTNEAADNNEAVVFVSSDINFTGYNINDPLNILGYVFDSTNNKILIYFVNYSDDNVTSEIKTTLSTTIESTKELIGKNGYLISIDSDTNIEIMLDSINKESLIINSENYKILNVSENYIEYISGNKIYRHYRNYKYNFNGGKVIPLSISVPKSNNTINNANMCKYGDTIFIASTSCIYKIDLKNSISKAIDILSFTDEFILGIGALKNKVFIIASSGTYYVINTETFEIEDKIKFSENISNTANVKFTIDKENEVVYFLINSVLYKYVNSTIDEVTNSLTSGQLLCASYIKAYNSIYYVMLDNTDNSLSVCSYNILKKLNNIFKTYNLNSVSLPTSEYVNVSKAAFYPNIMIDEYGNCVILGGNSVTFDGNPSHLLTIIGTKYDDYIESELDKNCKDLAYTSCVDDNYIYTLGIGSNGYADLIISNRNENEYKGSTCDISDIEPISSKKIFTFNNEIYGFDIFNKTNQIVKYNKTKRQFDLYSLSALEPNGAFVSAKAFEDGSLYLIFAYYNSSKIYLNIICYNLNTKKIVYNVSDEVFDNTNLISQLSVSNHSCWRGKYLITKLSTYSDSVLLVINILKRSKFCVRSSVTSGSTFTGSSEYFNGDMIFAGNGNKYSISNFISPSEQDITDAELSDSSALLLSGNRALITGIKTKEITTKNSTIEKSISKIVRKNSSNKSFIVPYLNNTILTGTDELIAEIINVNYRPDIYDLIKSPIKEIKLSDKFGLRVYSGSSIDTFVTYDISNYDIIDSIDIPKEYGLGISDIINYADNRYLIIHTNTLNISTFIFNADTGKITIKRYDNTVFGESTNTDTNIHSIQQVDLTMIFDNDMDERDIRSSN